MALNPRKKDIRFCFYSSNQLYSLFQASWTNLDLALAAKAPAVLDFMTWMVAYDTHEKHQGPQHSPLYIICQRSIAF